MRIIVWGINYAPEETGIGPFNTGMCEWLAARGHDVEMVTTFTYYPAWRKLADDRGRLFRTDRVRGVQVRRCWHYVPAKVTALKRIVHEATFIVTSFMRLVFMKRPDVLVVVSPPLPLGVPARFLRFLWRRPYVFHVQDLQPDAAVGLGMLKPGLFTRMLYWLEGVAYQGASAVGGISTGMLSAFAVKRVPADRRMLFPNWIVGTTNAIVVSSRLSAKSSFCAKHGLDPGLPLAVYSGNLGEKQGLAGVLDSAATDPGRQVQWVIAGDGAGRAALEARIRRDGLANVWMLQLQPKGDFEQMLAAADACLVTQQRGSGQYFFPSKLLTLLTLGCPVLAVADDSSELAVAVVESRAGIVVPPGEAVRIAEAVTSMANADEGQRLGWSTCGKEWVGRFARDRVLTEFERRLDSIVRK